MAEIGIVTVMPALGSPMRLDEWESLSDAPARPPGSSRSARALNSGQRSSGTLLCGLRTL
jgi:hypothetical protein